MIEKKMNNKESKLYLSNDNKYLNSKKLFGFWIYLMSDCIIFAVLFSVYTIISLNMSINLMNYNFFNLFYIFLETLILLLSSLFCGMLMIEQNRKNINMVYLYLSITFLLGFIFILMEIYEFYELIQKSYYPSKNAFFSIFFTIIGMHGIHIFVGLIWILSIIYQLFYLGLTKNINIRIMCFSFFWHFLDIIWICIFTFVYLNKAI